MSSYHTTDFKKTFFIHTLVFSALSLSSLLDTDTIYRNVLLLLINCKSFFTSVFFQRSFYVCVLKLLTACSSEIANDHEINALHFPFKFVESCAGEAASSSQELG